MRSQHMWSEFPAPTAVLSWAKALQPHTTHAGKDRNARKRAHTSSFVMLNEIWLPPHDWLAHFRSLGGGGGE